MIVDTSAVVAILKDEPEREAFVEALVAAEGHAMSAATYVELCAVVDRLENPAVSRQLDDLLDRFGIEIVDVTIDQARLARAAYRDFGRGRHPAALNFGDLFSYALAASSRQELLHKGDDFSQTDVRSAVG